MAFKALLSLKTCLRHRLDIQLNKSVIVVTNRHLRGRTRFDSSNESQEVDYEAYDEEVQDMTPNRFTANPKTDRRDRQDSNDYRKQDLYDNRRKNSYESRRQDSEDFYDSRRQDPRRQNSYDNRRESSYDTRREGSYDTRRDGSYDTRQQSSGFGGKAYRDVYQRAKQDFDYQSNRFNRNDFKREKFNKFDNNYGNEFRNDRNWDRNRNNNRNDGFDDRFNQFQKRDDRKQMRDYKSYKHRNAINEFSQSEDNNENAIYSGVDQQFESDERPRFSRFRENELTEMKKIKRYQRSERYSDGNENYIQDLETETTGEDIEDVGRVKKSKELIPNPFNVTLENRFEVLNQIVTPLHLKPYETQLNIKFRKNAEILHKFGKKLKLTNSPVIRDAKGLPCPLECVKPSPMTERYRNKDEFSIWPGVDGFNKTVGFFVGQPSIHENVFCVEPDHIIVSRESHLSIAKKFQNYLKEVSKYDSCQNYGEGGNWRRFHIRSNAEGQHMISAIMHPQELTQQELNEEMIQLKQYFEGDERIHSLYFQASRHTRLSNEKEPYIHLMGARTITETLFDMKFEVSVDSFFQINTSAAEILYRNIISELGVNRKTTVLDVCCGTGTLATILASDVCRVIGIDSSASAISDAKKNSAINGVKNVTFIAGAVEQELPKLVNELYSEDIVVVANPTRGGLHSSVINTLRQMSFVRKIVYVSCKPEGNAFKNFVHLSVPAGKQSLELGAAFVPTNAIPVDLFPHTGHCELILTFERF